MDSRRIVEKEAAIVRRIFRQYLEGKTFSTIARLLEKDWYSLPRPVDACGNPQQYAPS